MINKIKKKIENINKKLNKIRDIVLTEQKISDTENKQSIQEKICRICYEPDNLIYPCKCKGSIKWVHEKCLFTISCTFYRFNN